MVEEAVATGRGGGAVWWLQHLGEAVARGDLALRGILLG